jgi:uncharacterized lipoprotein YajG
MSISLKIIILSLILLAGCSKNQSTIQPIDPAVSGLTGNYTSVSFTAPDPADLPIDVQAGGGSVQISLNENKEYTAVILVPKGVMWEGDPGDTLKYTGAFSLSNDTIKLNSFHPGVYKIKWDHENNSLKSVNETRWTIQFSLKKVKSN